MSDYDNRQFAEMVNRIDSYRQGNLPFAKLVGDLEALLCALESADNTWKQAFQREWSKLELLYADSLDKGQASFTAEANQIAEGAVTNLRKLANDALK